MFERNETSEQRQKRLARERKANSRKKQKNVNTVKVTHHDFGRMDQRCHHCDAKFWLQEKDHKSNRTSPILMMCCANGKICLPPLLKPLIISIESVYFISFQCRFIS